MFVAQLLKAAAYVLRLKATSSSEKSQKPSTVIERLPARALGGQKQPKRPWFRADRDDLKSCLWKSALLTCLAGNCLGSVGPHPGIGRGRGKSPQLGHLLQSRG